MIGHDLESHTPVYIRSHSSQCMSEQKPSNEVEGRAPRQGCVEAQIWGRVPKTSAALKDPKKTMAFFILKWRTFGSTKTLPRAGCLAKLSNQGEKGLGQGGDQEPDGHSDKAPEFLCGDGRTFQKDNHL